MGNTARLQAALAQFRRPWLITGIVLVGAYTTWQRFKPQPTPPVKVSIERNISALGRLTPEGGLITLSVPGGPGGISNDVIENWFVGEGAAIRQGQILAQMRSYRQLKSQLAQAESNLASSKILLPFLRIGQTRGAILFQEGAISEQDLGKSVAAVETRKATIDAAEAGVQIAMRQLEAAQIRSPINGSLIRIFSQPGMKETSDGLALIGRTNAMEVWAQVYQADIDRLRLGQAATIRAESGGFTGTLKGTLKTIVGNVSSRDLFATNNNNNVNARVVLAKLSLDAADIGKVKSLSGLNVVVTFER